MVAVALENASSLRGASIPFENWGVMMRSIYVSIGAMALASCGSDNGSVDNGAAAIPVTPVVTPTPTPTPTPAASSTPAPPNTPYLAAFDFARDRSFDSLITASTTQTVPARLVYGGSDSGTIAYSAVNQALTAFGMMTIVPNQMGATLTKTEMNLIYTYMVATSGATLGVYRATADTTYVSYLRQDELVKPLPITRFALLGAPTLTTDLPLGAASTYRLTVAQIGTTPTGQSLVVDGASRRVTGTVLIGLPGSVGTVSVAFQGVLDAATGRVDGTARTSEGAYTGAFHGRLYGPAGIEIGMIFDLADGNGNDLPGIIVGRST